MRIGSDRVGLAVAGLGALGLFAAPLLLAFTDGTARVNSFVCGIAVLAIVVRSMLRAQSWEGMTRVMLAAWTVMAPAILSFATDRVACLVHVACGLLVLVGSVMDASSGAWDRDQHA